jgi:hypothetical protein
MYSHTAAASLLAAAACGGLVVGSNSDAGDATIPDAHSGDSGQDATTHPGDGGLNLLGDGTPEEPVCDSGPEQFLDACGDVCQGHCVLLECKIRCPVVVPPYGRPF